MNNQVTMMIPKETNKALITDSKEIWRSMNYQTKNQNNHLKEKKL